MRAIYAVARMAGFNVRLLNHVNKLAVFRPFPGELDLTVFFRKQRVVATDADVHARMKMRATLANDNVAGNNFLAAVDLDAQSFAL